MISKIHLSLLFSTVEKKRTKKVGGGSQHFSYFKNNNTDTVDETEKSQT